MAIQLRTSGVFNLGSLGGDGSDTDFDSVVLLLDGSGGGNSTVPDSSSINNTVTNVSSGVSNANITGPYGATQDVLSFDGSNDSLEFTVSSDMELAGDFTIEAWVQRSSVSTRQCLIAYWGVSGDPRFRIEFDRVPDNISFFAETTTHDFSSSGTNTEVANTWFHLAATRSGSTYEIFIDGSSLGTLTGSTATFTGSSTYSNKGHIGSLTNSTTFFGGKIADFRITKGVARYTNNFTPPASALPTTAARATRPTRKWGGLVGRSLVETTESTEDPYWDDTVLYLRANNNSTDETGRHTPTMGTGGYSTNVPFSASSNTHSFNFNNTTAHRITLPNSTDFQFGSGEFTIEAFVRWDGTGQLGALFNTYEGTGTGDGMLFGVAGLAGGNMRLYCSSNGSSWDMANGADGGMQLTANTWHHIALVRESNGSIYSYKDGTKTTTALSTSTASIYTNGTDDAHIGGNTTNYEWMGQIDEFRITKGVARYTGDFIAPTASFPTSASTTNVPTTGVLSLAEHYQSKL